MADAKSFISFEIDTSKAQAELEAVDKAIKKVREDQQNLNKQLETGVINQQQYDKESAKLTQQLEKLTEKHKKVSKAVAEENSVLAKATKTAKALGGEGGSAINSVTNSIGGLSNAFKALIANPIIATITVIVGLFVKLKDAIAKNEELQNRMNVVMAAFQPIGNAVANIFDSIANFLVTCVEKMSEFIPALENGIVKISKFITRFTPLGQIMKQFGIDLGESTEKAVKNFEKQREVTQQLEKDTQALNKAQQEYSQKSADRQAKINELQEQLANKENLTYKQRIAKTKELTELKRKDLEEQRDLLQEELRIELEKAELAPNSAADNKKLADLKLKVANAQKAVNAAQKQGINLLKSEKKAINSEISAKRKEQEKYIKDLTKATDDDIFQKSLEGLSEYEKAVKQIEHSRLKVVEEITEQIKKVEEYGNKELADKLRERLEVNQKALDTQLAEATKKRDDEAKKSADEIEKRSQDIANKLAQAELKGKSGEQLIKAELDYNKRVLEQKKNQDLLQANLTNEDKLNIEKAYQLERISLEKDADKQIAELHKQMEENKQKETINTLNIYASSLSEMGNIMQNLQQLSQEDSRQSQALAKVAIALQMALAMANGIKSAMEQTFPVNLIAAAATVAELAVMFKKIKETKNEKFAKGGLIGGSGSGTSDSNVQGGIAVSKGESVINAKGTRLYGGLLSAINQSTGGEPIRTASNSNIFYNQLRNALASMPSPVVSVVDINKGQDRQNYVKTISRPV